MLVYRALVEFVLLACGLSFAAAQQQVVVVTNNLFTAAGFVAKYATTPEKKRNPEILATGQAGKANEKRPAILRLRRCGRLQLCVRWDAASVCGLPELGKRRWRSAIERYGNDR